MQTIGLTPIDSALSIYGLNIAQELNEFFFIDTKFGVTAFVIGFFWSIWESIREASFRRFIVFIFITLMGIVVFITPHKTEPAFKSQMEEGGAVVSITAKALKESQTTLNQIPVVLSFIGLGADSIIREAIMVLDQPLSDDKKFLKNPFNLQKLSLQDNQNLSAPINNANKVDDFIYAEYLPTLILNNTSVYDFNLHDEPIKGLLEQLDTSWVKTREILTRMGSATEVINKQIVSSIVKGQIHQEKSSLIWPLSLSIYTAFPYILGWANFCLYAAFPILMLVLIVFRRLSIFLRYAEIFLWIKSWELTAAMAHYVSLIAVQIQFKTAPQPNWFWEYPYFAVVCAVLLLLMPALSLIGIHQGFQLVNNNKLRGESTDEKDN